MTNAAVKAAAHNQDLLFHGIAPVLGVNSQKIKTASVLAIDVLHTSSFHGCVPSETSHIELSAQLGDVKMIILESV